MLVILPPSETKRDGGESAALDLETLTFPALTAHRRSTVAALSRLSRSVTESNRALHLGPTQRFEIDRNRALRTAPTMPAIERYTGVLFDGLDAATLTPSARSWVGGSVVIHSALFGLLSADDPIPAYRLSHSTRLPGLALAKHWRDAITATLAEYDGLVLDLRSEAYEAMGPAPGSLYLRVVTEGAGGVRRALNHFNKKGKGELVRAMAEDSVAAESLDDLLAWARARGIRLERSAQGASQRELFLVV